MKIQTRLKSIEKALKRQAYLPDDNPDYRLCFEVIMLAVSDMFLPISSNLSESEKQSAMNFLNDRDNPYLEILNLDFDYLHQILSDMRAAA